MNKLALIALVVASTASAQTYVNPHMRSDGTYVQGHMRTAPDRNPYNNYSTQGNVNPYTGSYGERNPVQVQQQYQPHPYQNQYQDQNRFYNSRPYQ